MGDPGARQPQAHVQVPGMWPYDADITGKGESDPRIRAISVVLAAEAVKNDDEVRRFREKHLGGSLLTPDKIRAWIESLPESSQDPAWYLFDLPIASLVSVANGSYIIPEDVMSQTPRRRKWL